jgi:hypothetical protein
VLNRIISFINFIFKYFDINLCDNSVSKLLNGFHTLSGIKLELWLYYHFDTTWLEFDTLIIYYDIVVLTKDGILTRCALLDLVFLLV